MTAARATSVLTIFIDTLPRLERLTLALMFKEGCTRSEAAKVLGMTEPRVDRVLDRALSKVRKALQAADNSA